MELRQLEIFAAVMSTGSLTAAGRSVGRSQPVISRGIQTLEQQLGYVLFERAGPRVQPTAEALQLYREVSPLLAGFRQLAERASAIGARQPLPLSLVATPALGSGLMPAALACEQDERLPAQIQLQLISAEQVVPAVLAGGVDLAVASLPLEHQGIDLAWIGEAPCVVVLAEDDPLAARETIGLKALAQRRILTLKNSHRLRQRCQEAFQQAGVNPRQLLETTQSMAAILAAREGLGVAIVDPATAHGIPLKGVRVVALEERIPFYWGVFSASARGMSPSAARLAEHIDAIARERWPGYRRYPAADYQRLLAANRQP